MHLLHNMNSGRHPLKWTLPSSLKIEPKCDLLKSNSFPFSQMMKTEHGTVNILLIISSLVQQNANITKSKNRQWLVGNATI